MLGAGDAGARLTAAEVLKQIAEGDLYTIEAVVAQLKAAGEALEGEAAAEMAAEALGRISEQGDHRVVDMVRAQLEDARHEVREVAIKGTVARLVRADQFKERLVLLSILVQLAERSGRQGVDAVAAWLDDETRNVRSRALWALTSKDASAKHEARDITESSSRCCMISKARWMR